MEFGHLGATRAYNCMRNSDRFQLCTSQPGLRPNFCDHSSTSNSPQFEFLCANVPNCEPERLAFRAQDERQLRFVLVPGLSPTRAKRSAENAESAHLFCIISNSGKFSDAARAEIRTCRRTNPRDIRRAWNTSDFFPPLAPRPAPAVLDEEGP